MGTPNGSDLVFGEAQVRYDSLLKDDRHRIFMRMMRRAKDELPHLGGYVTIKEMMTSVGRREAIHVGSCYWHNFPNWQGAKFLGENLSFNTKCSYCCDSDVIEDKPNPQNPDGMITMKNAFLITPKAKWIRWKMHYRTDKISEGKDTPSYMRTAMANQLEWVNEEVVFAALEPKSLPGLIDHFHLMAYYTASKREERLKAIQSFRDDTAGWHGRIDTRPAGGDPNLM